MYDATTFRYSILTPEFKGRSCTALKCLKALSSHWQIRSEQRPEMVKSLKVSERGDCCSFSDTDGEPAICTAAMASEGQQSMAVVMENFANVDQADCNSICSDTDEEQLSPAAPAVAMVSRLQRLKGFLCDTENRRNIAASVCLWTTFVICATAFSLMGPFFPGEVNIACLACKFCAWHDTKVHGGGIMSCIYAEPPASVYA